MVRGWWGPCIREEVAIDYGECQWDRCELNYTRRDTYIVVVLRQGLGFEPSLFVISQLLLPTFVGHLLPLSL